MRVKPWYRRITLGLAVGLALSAGQVRAQAETIADNDQDQAERDRLEQIFAKGMGALEEDRLRTAIEAFSSILSTDPSLHRARLELAVAYYRSLNYARARELAQRVLDDPNTPPSVRVSITAFLAQVKAEEKRFSTPHEWKRMLGFGVMHDSNVNVGPSSDILNIDGQTVRLVTGQDRGSNALYYNIGFSHRYNPGRIVPIGERNAQFFWQSEANLYYRDYDRYGDDYNLTILHGSTGPAWVLLKYWRSAINLQADYVWLGDSRLAYFAGVRPLSTWQFNNGEVTVDAELTQRRYHKSQDTGRDGTYFNFGGSLNLYFNDRKLVVQAGLHRGDFNAHADEFANTSQEMYLGALGFAGRGTRLYARGTQRFYQYEGPVTGTSTTRNERERRLTVGVEHDIRSANELDKWTLNANISRTLNASNLDLYDYDRTQLSAGISRNF